MAYFDDLNPCESDDEYVPRGPTIPKKVQWVTPKVEQAEQQPKAATQKGRFHEAKCSQQADIKKENKQLTARSREDW